ncbi:MAG: hypothetical protein AAFS10_08260, partial [Myxococcota bacterium]
MGKKKNRRGEQQASTKQDATSAEDALAFNPFAEKLKGLKARKQEEADRKRAQEEAQAQKVREQIQEAERQERQVIARAEALDTSGVVEMSAEELFDKAIEELDPVKIHSGKYMGKGPDTQHVRIKEERMPAPAEIKAMGDP